MGGRRTERALAILGDVDKMKAEEDDKIRRFHIRFLCIHLGKSSKKALNQFQNLILKKRNPYTNYLRIQYSSTCLCKMKVVEWAP